MVRTDRGSVCRGDGWPVDLWSGFTSVLDQLPGRSVCERLQTFLRSNLKEEVPIVAEWRRLLQDPSPGGGLRAKLLGTGWIPVPAKLELPFGTSACILSWSASPLRFDSLYDALESEYARRESVDLTNQAKYYMECILARLHGVTFGPNDSIEDKEFERTPVLLNLVNAFTELETRRIADPALGSLSHFR